MVSYIRRPKSGHITCYLIRTYHVLTTLQASDIAKSIGTTANVIKNHLRVIFDKTGTWTRLELALWYVKTN